MTATGSVPENARTSIPTHQIPAGGLTIGFALFYFNGF
jgi:hypothetical protein